MNGRSRFAVPATLLACTLLFAAGCGRLKAKPSRKDDLEKQAAVQLSQLMSRDSLNFSCTGVRLTEQIDGRTWKAAAALDNGEELDIIVEDRGDTLRIAPDMESNSAVRFCAREAVTRALRGAGDPASCTGIELVARTTDNNFRAKAALDNGTTIEIVIDLRGEHIRVQMPPAYTR